MQSEKVEKMRLFLEENSSLFSEREIEHLRNELLFIQEGCKPSVLACEILDHLGFLPEEWNIYEGFVKLLQKNFDLNNRRIVEVAGGILPRLGIRISEKLEKGHIVVYDPRLSKREESTSRLLLKREKFRGVLDDSRNLIIGLLPCEATPYIIDAIEDYGMDFMFTLSNGLEITDIDASNYSGVEEWINAMVNRTKDVVSRRGLGELCEESLESRGLNPAYKVLYNKRKS